MKFYPLGTRIAGRYEVASRPLMGGMGIVHLCFDHEEQRPVALKTFRPEFLPDRAARDRFLREGTHWVDLGAHPHVVRCYDVLYTDPQVYLVLELVAKEQGREDVSLRSWLIPGKPLPVEQALLFALQIARGMTHATATIPGFVHRDLKPENVLVGADRLPQAAVNRLRVTDFGLAAVLQATAPSIGEPPTSHLQPPTFHPLGRTQLTHGVVGTPYYMAPEQWRGEPVTVATDVYALGCILYEMVAGRRAVEGRSLAAMERAHCRGEVQPLPGEVVGEVGALVERCLVVEPGGRYGSWAEVEEALAKVYGAVTGAWVPGAEPVAALSRGERVAAGWSYNAMGASYLDIGKAEVALGYFERAQGVGQEEGDRQLEGAALGNLGIAYKNLGDVRCAIGYYEQVLAILREIGDRRGEGIALMGLGLAYADLGEARRAIGYLEQRLEIAREIGDRRGEGNALMGLGNAYADLGEARRAIRYYEQQLVITQEIGDRQGTGAGLGDLGGAYFQLGDARRAIGYYEQHLAIAREIGDRRGEGLALNNLGEAYRNLGEARRAIGFLEQALAIAREIGNRRGEGLALGNLGNAYADLGEARRAIGFYEQHLAIAREIGDRRGEGLALGNLGSAYLQLENARRAIGFLEQALAVAREIGDRCNEGNWLGNLGSAYLNLGDTWRAIEYDQQALKISQEIGDVLTAAMFSTNLAMSLARVGRVGEALPLAEQAVRDFRQAGYPQQAQQAERMLAQIRAALR